MLSLNRKTDLLKYHDTVIVLTDFISQLVFSIGKLACTTSMANYNMRSSIR